jgi:hypothetical protein
MDDLQKKLDELTALRDTLVHLINTDNKLTDAFSINYEFDYTGKIHTIVKKHQQQIKENTVAFNNSIKESQQSAKEKQRKAHVIFKNKNNITIDKSINSIKSIIHKIETDIDTVSIEITKLIALEKIRTLCESADFVKLYLETYLHTHKIDLTDNALEIVLTKIKSYSNWYYPGLQVNPVSKEWVDCMVTADPLYLINHSDVLTNNEGTYYIRDKAVTEVIVDYPEEYQRRLRVYNIQNQDFSVLPQEQFGIIACCDFLNFFNIDIINNYLSTFFELLRPGGKLVCTLKTVHPCEPDTLIEKEYHKYTSELVVKNLFRNKGYDIVSITDLTSEKYKWEYICLITVQKPGVLATSKAHQVLGSIVEK